MATCPPVYVDAPVAQPRRFGLFSVAQFPVAPDHFECGVQFQPDTCKKAFALTDPDCPPGGVSGDFEGYDFDGNRGIPTVEAEPFHVYAPYSCSIVGTDLAEAQRRAERTMALGEERAVERAFWTGADGGESLANADAVLLGDQTDGLSPIAALALLEDWLGREYGGIGTLHAPRGLATYWTSALLMESNRLHTHMGTLVAAGGGYSAANTGPDGTVAPAGKAWVYATGAVSIWRGPVTFNPQPLYQALDRTTNMVELVAERTYVVASDCQTAAALVDLSCCPCL